MKLDDIIPKGMELIALKGWSQFNLRELARKEKIDFYQLTNVVPTKETFLSLTMLWIDAQYIAQRHETACENISSLSEREEIFEAIMGRLDLLIPYRKALRNIKETVLTDPSQMWDVGQGWVYHLYKNFKKSSEGSIFSNLALVALYIRTFWMWIDDDESFSLTLKTLDQNIHQVFDFMNFIFKK